MKVSEDRRDGVVVRASALQSVDLGFIPLVESYQNILKNVIYSLPAWRSAFMGSCGQQAGKFTCCVLGQGIQRDAPPLCGRQVTRKWQLPDLFGSGFTAFEMALSYSAQQYTNELWFPLQHVSVAQSSKQLSTK